MDYEAVGNSYVFWGAMLVAVGALLFSAAWFLASIYKQTNEWLEKRRWLRICVTRVIIIVGTVFILLGVSSWMVAKGGTLQTKGWNFISLGEQRGNLIRALTQEWFMNIDRLVTPPMKGEIHYVKEDGVHVWRPFPTLRTNTLNTTLSSGLWNYGNQMDRKFLDAVANYEQTVILANRKFRSYDDFLSKIKDPNERILQTEELRILTCEKDWFKSLENTQNQLGKLIWSQYRWAIETQLPEVYELLRKRLQEKSTASEPAEGLPKKAQRVAPKIGTAY